MPEITTNIELVKIQSNENYNVAIENENLDKIDAAVGGKVDKAVGKGLSTEDYSSAEKEKLAGIEALVAGLYALKTHNHDLVYSPYVHNHDAAYASKAHGHSGVYAVIGHNHDTAYLGKTAKASDSVKLNGQLAAYYATAGHNHSGTYEPLISKKSGFNLSKSDSVTSTSTSVLATSKATKTAYDKGVEALNKANTKLDATYGDSLATSTSFTLNAGHKDRVIRAGSTSNRIITIPNGVFINGDQITVLRTGLGTVTFATASGVTLYSLDSKRSIKGLYASATIVFASSTVAYLFGTLE